LEYDIAGFVNQQDIKHIVFHNLCFTTQRFYNTPGLVVVIDACLVAVFGNRLVGKKEGPVVISLQALI
jgi:hypothetical protein